MKVETTLGDKIQTAGVILMAIGFAILINGIVQELVTKAYAQEALAVPEGAGKVEVLNLDRLTPRERDEVKKTQRTQVDQDKEVLRQLQIMNNTLLRIEAKI